MFHTVRSVVVTAFVPGLVIGLLLAVVQFGIGFLFVSAAPLALLATGAWVVPAVALLSRTGLPFSGVVASVAAALPVGLISTGIWSALLVGFVAGLVIEAVFAAGRHRSSWPVAATAGGFGGAAIAASGFGGAWLAEAQLSLGLWLLLMPVVGGVGFALAGRAAAGRRRPVHR